MADSRKSRGSGRRKPVRRENSTPTSGHLDESGGLSVVLARWTEVSAVALLVARVLIPTEGAVQGDTLWIALCWFPLAAVWLLVYPANAGPPVEEDSTRQPLAAESHRHRGGWFRLADAAVLLLALGHVLATAGVFAAGGNRRSAVNLTWEWIALAVGWFVLKSMLARREFRRQLAVVLVALAVAESGYGIWQHYVWYPQTSRLYSGIRAELDELESRPGLTSAEEARRSTLQGQLIERQIPLEGPARSMWENRLKASTEPFGTFALANSFAGYLAGWLFVALGFAVVPLRALARETAGEHSRPARAVAGSLVILVPLLLCLLLTKSRTAWVGSCCGAAVMAAAWWTIRRNRQSDSAGTEPAAAAEEGSEKNAVYKEVNRHRGIRLAAAAGLVVLLAGVVAGLASLDAEVMSEAPRSVRYRLQYWHGAVQVIREHPLLGVGPGNFRQHYLAHKLPESSEEIADPHNLVLDIWASGGATALCGLLLLLTVLAAWCWQTLQQFRRPDAESAGGSLLEFSASESQPGRHGTSGEGAAGFSAGGLGGCAGFLLVLLSAELTGGGSEPAIWLMTAGWLGILFILRNRSNPTGLLCVGSLAGAVALTVHLSGAGGIEMPAVVELLFVLLLLSGSLVQQGGSERGTPVASSGQSRSSGTGLRTAGTVGCFVLAVLCWSTAAGPEWQRRIETVLGDTELMRTGRIEVSEQHYRRAAVLDPLSPEPVARLAELAFRRWQAAPELNEQRFKEAVRLQELAILQDPAGPGGFRRLGEYWLARSRQSGNAEHAAAAVEAYESAIERYPAYARLRADFAQALSAAGKQQAAAEQATEALRLNDINRREGHTDKLLDQERLNALKNLP